MPVKKTTTDKKTAVKKTPVKKTHTTKATTHKKVEMKKPEVIVETKKTTQATKKSDGFLKVLFVLLILLNLLFTVLNYTKKDAAMKIEEMKVGWSANYEKVMKLYKSDFYKDQQSAAIKQFMWQ